MKNEQTQDNIKVYCAHDELVSIEEIQANPKNPNVHPREQIQLLGKVIRKNGWRVPLTVSKRSGLLVKGHGRLKAAQYERLTEAPVDYQEYETDDAELADLLADNRVAELSDMDPELLSSMLNELKEIDFDFESAGYTQKALDAMVEFEAITEDDFLNDDFALPDGDIENKKVMVKITLFVSEHLKKKVTTQIKKYLEQFDTRDYRVMK